MSNSPLSIQHIHKRYGQQHVLNDIGFDLNNGEIFGLIGLNGAGKTTLIKLLLGLADADDGQISIFGEEAGSVAARRHVSYLPEKFQPSRYLRGLEYLSLSLSYYGKTLDADIARELAKSLDLDPEKLESRVGAYSKGMGQKLGLMGAFMVDVPLLILDEPMSGLDPSARIKLKRRLLALRAEKKTVFFSSHILSDLDEICDRIGVIHDGKLLFVGTPEAFKAAQKDSNLEAAFLKSISVDVAA